MSIKEAMHYLRHNGLSNTKINSYARINSVLAARYALINFGPFAAGLPVYNNGPKFWKNTSGRFFGGHCIVIVGYDDEKA